MYDIQVHQKVLYAKIMGDLFGSDEESNNSLQELC
jgi:hypothetical protein